MLQHKSKSVTAPSYDLPQALAARPTAHTRSSLAATLLLRELISREKKWTENFLAWWFNTLSLLNQHDVFYFLLSLLEMNKVIDVWQWTMLMGNGNIPDCDFCLLLSSKSRFLPLLKAGTVKPVVKWVPCAGPQPTPNAAAS